MVMTLIACDAVNHIQYIVKNQTDQTIRLHIPHFPVDPNQGMLSQQVDTIIEVKPNEFLWVGTSPMDIDFPWAAKKIYKKSPGVCGIELIEKDTLINLDCTDSSWKYKRNCSTLKIK